MYATSSEENMQRGGQVQNCVNHGMHITYWRRKNSNRIATLHFSFLEAETNDENSLADWGVVPFSLTYPLSTWNSLRRRRQLQVHSLYILLVNIQCEFISS